VLPALAVAESLRTLGAEVTFASNSHSRLVRDAGYDLDVFGIEGFPREVSVRLAKALGRAAAAVPVCVRILRRRRPDIVLGGGGYVAGPMVLAAGGMRIPAALSEADAHLGLANRLAAPFAREVFLAYPVEGLEPPKYQVVGRPIPARSQPGDAHEARRRFELPEEGPVVLVFGGSQGAQRLNEAALQAFGNSGPAVLHLAGERACFRSRTTSARRSPQPTSSLPARVAPCGRSRPPAGRRCSSRIPTRLPTTRPKTLATSSAVEAPWSFPSPSSSSGRRSTSCLPTQRGSRRWGRG
jgi:UDP-N-acetylglucosamine:LPS N-acetylglucosamine transferase